MKLREIKIGMCTLGVYACGMALSQAQQDHLVFEATGESNGKHVVLLAGDEEYRSEESMPMMAQLLSEQGFKCTVLFSMDKDNKFVDPANQKSLSNPVALDSADAIVMCIRFRNWGDEAFEKFNAAFERGVPMVALRTSTHAFKVGAGSKWAKYSFNAKSETGWDKGFGRQVLGETWVSHHGKHKKEATRTHIEKGAEENAILNGVGEIFCTSDVYGADPMKPATILLRGAVTESFEPDSADVEGKNDPMQPVAWTREYKQESGKVNKVLTTTMGAATDLEDEDLRRLVVNGVYWGLDMKVPAKADVTIDGEYKPSFYGFKGFKKKHTPSDFVLKKEAEVMKTMGPEVPTSLNIGKNSRIGFIGGGLASRMNLFSEFETELQLRYPENDLYIRNWGKEGDTPAFRPHPSRKSHWVIPGGKELVKREYQAGGGKGHYETPDEWLTRHEIDTVIGFFGYSESFDGLERLEGYKAELRAFIKYTLSQKYSGAAPQLAIVSPAAFEDLSAKRDLPNGEETNKNLEAYSKAMSDVCKEEGVLFVDAFSATKGFYNSTEEDLTSNGHNLNEAGYEKLAPMLANLLFGKKEVKADDAQKVKVQAAVAEKNRVWLLDYKIPNGVHVHGRRYKPFGNVNYPDELTKIRQMTEIRDKALWAVNKGEAFDMAAADAKTIKLKPVESNSNRPVKYATGKEMESKLTLPEGYEMKLFADEKMFPDLANPSQMAFDNKGRLWVSCMPSYPQYRIGDPLPNDKIIIFEDTDNDGVADKQTVFVDHIVTPMGFEITEHGVFVSLQNDLVLFKDTDGDDKADTREVVLSGFDDHDTHHAISSFCADPSGAFYMGEGVFLHSNVETPYGPVRGTNGGFYRYNPAKGRLERAAQYSIPNPWGIAFNDWGQNFFLHTSGTKLSWMQQSAVKSRYNVNLTAPDLLTSNKVRPTSGLEFVSSRHFPDDVQGDALICNNIGFLGAMQHKVTPDGENGYKTEFRQKLFQSSDPYFRPVDLEFAPDGSLYVIDWSNVLIGHMQHNARDPKRDHVHGRIYRITYPSRPLVPIVKVDGAGIDELLENLKVPEIRTRYRVRRELRGRDAGEVAAALTKWVAGLDKSDPRYSHHLTEAMWVSWGIDKIDSDILNACLTDKEPRARAAATRAVRFNADKLENAVELLKKSAGDPNAQVRHEAVVAASWMGKEDGLAIIAEFEKTPVNAWSEDAAKFGKSHLNDETLIIKKNVVKLPRHLKKADTSVQKSYQKGEVAYHHAESCVICHGVKGEGNAQAGIPPLDGSKWVTGDKVLLTKIALHGIMGEIEVKGKKYNSAMAGFDGRVPNRELADILTYVRNAWSNKTGDFIGKKQVDTIQKATDEQNKKGPYQAADLLKAHPMK
ncbi:MAG: PVC-type heme-binding CxxCH protein [Akkermansiaceae bacterium]